MGELVIRIDPDTAERLLRISASGRESAEDIALAAIMERLEELEDEPEALRRLQQIQHGSVQTVRHGQAMRDGAQES